MQLTSSLRYAAFTTIFVVLLFLSFSFSPQYWNVDVKVPIVNQHHEIITTRLRVLEEWLHQHSTYFKFYGNVSVVVPLYPYTSPRVLMYDHYAWSSGGISKQEIEAVSRVRNYFETIRGQAGKSRICLPEDTVKVVEDYSICSELLYFKIIQLVWPEATNFIDIGSNKGFLSATFLSLWGGNGLGITPLALARALYTPPQTFVSPAPFGVCRTGLNRGYPLHCPDKSSRQMNGYCAFAKEDIRVVSIDGSRKVVTNMSDIVLRSFSGSGTGSVHDIPSMWQHFQFAMADKKGMAAFRVHTEDSAYEGSGIVGEGGKVRGGGGGTMRIESVPQTTLDAFLKEEESVLKGQRVDILKIDAEGRDLQVVCAGHAVIYLCLLCLIHLDMSYYHFIYFFIFN